MRKNATHIFSEKLVKIIILLRKRSNEIGDVKPYHMALIKFTKNELCLIVFIEKNNFI